MFNYKILLCFVSILLVRNNIIIHGNIHHKIKSRSLLDNDNDKEVYINSLMQNFNTAIRDYTNNINITVDGNCSSNNSNTNITTTTTEIRNIMNMADKMIDSISSNEDMYKVNNQIFTESIQNIVSGLVTLYRFLIQRQGVINNNTICNTLDSVGGRIRVSLYKINKLSLTGNTSVIIHLVGSDEITYNSNLTNTPIGSIIVSADDLISLANQTGLEELSIITTTIKTQLGNSSYLGELNLSHTNIISDVISIHILEIPEILPNFINPITVKLETSSLSNYTTNKTLLFKINCHAFRNKSNTTLLEIGDKFVTCQTQYLSILAVTFRGILYAHQNGPFTLVLLVIAYLSLTISTILLFLIIIYYIYTQFYNSEINIYMFLWTIIIIISNLLLIFGLQLIGNDICCKVFMIAFIYVIILAVNFCFCFAIYMIHALLFYKEETQICYIIIAIANLPSIVYTILTIIWTTNDVKIIRNENYCFISKAVIFYYICGIFGLGILNFVLLLIGRIPIIWYTIRILKGCETATPSEKILNNNIFYQICSILFLLMLPWIIIAINSVVIYIDDSLYDIFEVISIILHSLIGIIFSLIIILNFNKEDTSFIKFYNFCVRKSTQGSFDMKKKNIKFSKKYSGEIMNSIAKKFLTRIECDKDFSSIEEARYFTPQYETNEMKDLVRSHAEMMSLYGIENKSNPYSEEALTLNLTNEDELTKIEKEFLERSDEIISREMKFLSQDENVMNLSSVEERYSLENDSDIEREYSKNRKLSGEIMNSLAKKFLCRDLEPLNSSSEDSRNLTGDYNNSTVEEILSPTELKKEGTGENLFLTDKLKTTIKASEYDNFSEMSEDKLEIEKNDSNNLELIEKNDINKNDKKGKSSMRKKSFQSLKKIVKKCTVEEKNETDNEEIFQNSYITNIILDQDPKSKVAISIGIGHSWRKSNHLQRISLRSSKKMTKDEKTKIHAQLGKVCENNKHKFSFPMDDKIRKRKYRE